MQQLCAHGQVSAGKDSQLIALIPNRLHQCLEHDLHHGADNFPLPHSLARGL